MSKNALITGGAGFIGSNLVRGLLEKGYKVRVIDDLSTGKSENLSNLSGDIDFERGDIRNLVLLRHLCVGIDYVFHLAAMNRAQRSIKDPITANDVNINGTLNVLMAARDTKVKKVIYSSSSSVYGDTIISPKIEVFNPKPLTPYAVSKLTGEYYCSVFNKLFNLKTVALRFFSVYGRYQRTDIEYAAVIPKFINEIKNKRQPVVYGDGKQTRPFTYVKDVVNACLLFAENDVAGVFNIAYQYSYSLNNLVECINRLLHENIKPIYEDERKGEVKHNDADISFAQSFGFNPKYSLGKGLAEIICGVDSE